MTISVSQITGALFAAWAFVYVLLFLVFHPTLRHKRAIAKAKRAYIRKRFDGRRPPTCRQKDAAK